MTITIEDQIRCAERELAMRKSAYPRWIASARLKEPKANHEIACMEAIIKTLHAVRDSMILPTR